MNESTTYIKFHSDIKFTINQPYIHSDHDQKSFENQYATIKRLYQKDIAFLQLTDDVLKEMIRNAINESKRLFN